MIEMQIETRKAPIAKQPMVSGRSVQQPRAAELQTPLYRPASDIAAAGAAGGLVQSLHAPIPIKCTCAVHVSGAWVHVADLPICPANTDWGLTLLLELQVDVPRPLGGVL